MGRRETSISHIGIYTHIKFIICQYVLVYSNKQANFTIQTICCVQLNVCLCVWNKEWILFIKKLLISVLYAYLNRANVGCPR